MESASINQSQQEQYSAHQRAALLQVEQRLTFLKQNLYAARHAIDVDIDNIDQPQQQHQQQHHHHSSQQHYEQHQFDENDDADDDHENAQSASRN